MGCCCDQNDDEDIQTHLLSSSSSSSSSSSFVSSADDLSTVISPMNSHFGALYCTDTLRIILSKLAVTDLARACCVCRVWNAVACANELIVDAFKFPWKLREVVGRPINQSFWRDNGISKFAVSHRIARGDTVQSLAVKYSVHLVANMRRIEASRKQVMDIKRLNNMMSDHGIYSRERLLIPISNPDILIDRTCHIELDTHAKREVAVIYLEGEPDRKHVSLLTRATSDQGKRRIIDSLRRCMRVDDETAQYYLSISNGDPRAALSQYSADLKWEKQIGLD
ncbi:hypothetical protein EZV62_006782 [Acer yangbiense]|uniref:LysM domain-containing protein n=1 Tax=Acer yangbiense TaxID=1000413 RepID=A0A5C7I8M2_9ROSI|nr:hypothetical protein EZV62_006782 [Acer yangbiense]